MRQGFLLALILAAGFSLVVASPALADLAQGFGDVASGAARGNANAFIRVLNYVCWATGIFLVISAPFKFLAYANKKESAMMTAGLVRLVGGGVLVSLPFMAKLMVRAFAFGGTSDNIFKTLGVTW